MILCPTSSKLETDPDDQQLNKTFIMTSQTPGSVIHVSSNVIGAGHAEIINRPLVKR